MGGRNVGRKGEGGREIEGGRKGGGRKGGREGARNGGKEEVREVRVE